MFAAIPFPVSPPDRKLKDKGGYLCYPPTAVCSAPQPIRHVLMHPVSAIVI